jgi:hypothetical protein
MERKKEQRRKKGVWKDKKIERKKKDRKRRQTEKHIDRKTESKSKMSEFFRFFLCTFYQKKNYFLKLK